MTPVDSCAPPSSSQSVSKQYGALRPLRIERLEIARRRSDRAARPRSTRRRSVHQSGHRREPARRRRRFASLAARRRHRRQLGLALDARSVRHRQRSGGAPRRAVDRAESRDAVLARNRAAARRTFANKRSRSGARSRTGRDAWDRRVGDSTRSLACGSGWHGRSRCNPSIMLFEHTSATLPRRRDVPFRSRDVRAIVERRGAAAIALTMDSEFAAAVAVEDPDAGRRRPAG